MGRGSGGGQGGSGGWGKVGGMGQGAGWEGCSRSYIEQSNTGQYFQFHQGGDLGLFHYRGSRSRGWVEGKRKTESRYPSFFSKRREGGDGDVSRREKLAGGIYWLPIFFLPNFCPNLKIGIFCVNGHTRQCSQLFLIAE